MKCAHGTGAGGKQRHPVIRERLLLLFCTVALHANPGESTANGTEACRFRYYPLRPTHPLPSGTMTSFSHYQALDQVISVPRRPELVQATLISAKMCVSLNYSAGINTLALRVRNLNAMGQSAQKALFSRGWCTSVIGDCDSWATDSYSHITSLESACFEDDNANGGIRPTSASWLSNNTLGPATWAPRTYPLNDVFRGPSGNYLGQEDGEFHLSVRVHGFVNSTLWSLPNFNSINATQNIVGAHGFIREYHLELQYDQCSAAITTTTPASAKPCCMPAPSPTIRGVRNEVFRGGSWQHSTIARQDTVIRVRTSIPSSPGCLFEIGGQSIGSFIGVVDSAFLFLAGIGLTVSRRISIPLPDARLPQDGSVLEIILAVNIDPASISIMVNGSLLATNSSSDGFPGKWSGSDKAKIGSGSAPNGGGVAPGTIENMLNLKPPLLWRCATAKPSTILLHP